MTQLRERLDQAKLKLLARRVADTAQLVDLVESIEDQAMRKEVYNLISKYTTFTPQAYDTIDWHDPQPEKEAIN